MRAPLIAQIHVSPIEPFALADQFSLTQADSRSLPCRTPYGPFFSGRSKSPLKSVPLGEVINGKVEISFFGGFACGSPPRFLGFSAASFSGRLPLLLKASHITGLVPKHFLEGLRLGDILPPLVKSPIAPPSSTLSSPLWVIRSFFVREFFHHFPFTVDPPFPAPYEPVSPFSPSFP